MKSCTKCKEIKSFEAFSRSRHSKTGYVSACKSCNKLYYSSEEFRAKRRVTTKLRYQTDEEYRKQVRDYQKQYRNTDEGRQYSRQQIANVLKDPARKIKHRLRTRMYHLIKGLRKTAGTEELIGCSAVELKTHLESQFQPSMTWDNYGEWHVDHIKPCSSFDLTDPTQQKICFNYTNLQPLWAKDNLSKGDKISQKIVDSTIST